MVGEEKWKPLRWWACAGGTIRTAPRAGDRLMLPDENEIEYSQDKWECIATKGWAWVRYEENDGVVTWALSPPSTPCPGLNDVLTIYKYSFFHDSDHRQFVQDNFETNTATLITSKEPDEGVIREHLLYRVPIYFGRTMHGHIYDNRLKSVLGYSSAEAKSHWKSPEPQYAIVGPVKMMKEDRRNVVIVHTWGVNLESTYTNDYQTYVANGFQTEAYTKRYENTFRLIVKAAQHVADGKKVRVRCPLIGMGAFVGSLTYAQKREAFRSFADAANTVLQATSIHWTFCIFPNPAYPTPSNHPLTTLLKGTSVDTIDESDARGVFIGLGRDAGNLMKLPGNDPDTMDVVVNAWDNRSFVGNGGSKDRTIDGFVVANAGGYNSDFRNTSYLHNYFFNPSMYDSKNWVDISI